MPSRANRGFSLLEAIFASFLMLTSIAIATFLVTTSMRASANNEKKIVASMVAESAMEDVCQLLDDHAHLEPLAFSVRQGSGNHVPFAV